MRSPLTTCPDSYPFGTAARPLPLFAASAIVTPPPEARRTVSPLRTAALWPHPRNAGNLSCLWTPAEAERFPAAAKYKSILRAAGQKKARIGAGRRNARGVRILHPCDPRGALRWSMPGGLVCSVHRELAAAMVASGIDEIHAGNGKVRSIAPDPARRQPRSAHR
jgi:hypothetical protein